jgi:hypothetical protein
VQVSTLRLTCERLLKPPIGNFSPSLRAY